MFVMYVCGVCIMFVGVHNEYLFALISFFLTSQFIFLTNILSCINMLVPLHIPHPNAPTAGHVCERVRSHCTIVSCEVTSITGTLSLHNRVTCITRGHIRQQVPSHCTIASHVSCVVLEVAAARLILTEVQSIFFVAGEHFMLCF